MSSPLLDVVVIGGGQAGLAMARQLQRQGLSFEVLDAAQRTGDSWRNRWDSLILFTTGQHSALPDLPFPGDPNAFPTKDAVADYLETYAARYALPIRTDTPVTALTRADGVFVAETSRGSIRARCAVVATGPFQQPVIPSIGAGFGDAVVQLHSGEYRNPDQLPSGPVLVVGGGNSGMQIAAELAAQRVVHLSIGETPRRLPARVLGRDVFWWLHHAGLITAGDDSRRGRWFRSRGGDVVIGTGRRELVRCGVRFHDRLVAADGGTARFADGSSVQPASVIWATGFRADYPWIRIPEAQIDDRIQHRRGVSPVEGLYVIGAPWQTSRGSALLGFVGTDAIHLAYHITALLSGTRESGGVPDPV